MLHDLLLWALAPLKRYAERHLVFWLDMGGDAPPPPDYTPVANASKEAAEISAQLGREQLDEAKRQYDQNMAVAQPVVNAQLEVMRQGLAQGNDYYNYQQNFRPLEQAMLANVTGMSAADVERLNAMRGDALNTARSTWQQQQDARMAELQQQIAAAQAQEARYAQQQQAAAQPSGTQFYVDAQGNVRTADAYQGLKESDPAQSGFLGSQLGRTESPGEGYKYYEFDNPNYGTQTTKDRSGFTDVGWDMNRTTGAWLKTTDAPSGGTAAAPQDPATLRSAQLQAELDKLRQQQFDQSGVDYSGANQEAQRLMMAGMQAKTQAEQAEVDRITGETRANAGELMARTRAYEQDAARDIGLFTGGNQGIYDKYRADIDADVGTAIADTRTGQTQAMNSALRQAMRYGLSVPSNAQALTNQNAAQLAAAANNTRTNAVNNYRSVIGQGIGLKQNAFTTGQAATMDAMAKQEGASMQGRNMRIQSDSLNWAKQLDVTGMARGMPGASQGAYSVATNAGNSATQNQMAPGNSLLGAMNQSNNTRMSGQQMAMQGLTGILNSQTSAYNAGLSADDGIMGALGTLGGAAITKWSDPRLKEKVVQVGQDERTGLHLYEYSYIDDPEQRRYVGVMADEVQERFPNAVVTDKRGFLSVNYALLGLELKEVA